MKKWIKLQISVTTHCHTYYSNIIMKGGMEKGKKRKKKQKRKISTYLNLCSIFKNLSLYPIIRLHVTKARSWFNLAYKPIAKSIFYHQCFLNSDNLELLSFYDNKNSIYTTETDHTYQTIPWAPEPIGFNCWYRFRTVKVESATCTL